MKIVKSILVPTDLTDQSRSAFEYASTLCKLFNAKLHLLYVMNKIPFETIPNPTDDMEKLYKGEVEFAENILKGFIEKHFGECPEVITKIVWGDPELEIVKYAEDSKIELIVMTSYGKPGLSNLAEGSISEKVVSLSPVTVMTVRPEKN